MISGGVNVVLLVKTHHRYPKNEILIAGDPLCSIISIVQGVGGSSCLVRAVISCIINLMYLKYHSHKKSKITDLHVKFTVLQVRFTMFIALSGMASLSLCLYFSIRANSLYSPKHIVGVLAPMYLQPVDLEGSLHWKPQI